MKQNILNETKTHMRTFWKMFHIMKEKNIAETIEQKIFHIIREETTQGSEQRYQAISKITDILNNSKTEQEVIQKLDKEFPTAE